MGVLLLGTLPLVPLSAAMAAAEAELPLETRFPHVLHVRAIPSQDFRPEDKITLIEVRGDKPQIAIGGTYLFRGEYELGSAPTALLMLGFRVGDSRPRKGSRTNIYNLERGKGTFSFVAKCNEPGQYHISLNFVTDPSGKRVSYTRVGYIDLQSP